jgi:hypothetical protein
MKGHMLEFYEGVDEDRSALELKALSFNCSVEFCRPHEVQIDLDTQEAFDLFQDHWCWFQTMMQHKKTRQPGNTEWDGKEQVFPDLEAEYFTSKSGEGKHVVVNVGFNRHIDDMERLLIACLLGSDLKREMLNYSRLKLHGDPLACLFRPKQKLLETGSLMSCPPDPDYSCGATHCDDSACCTHNPSKEIA